MGVRRNLCKGGKGICECLSRAEGVDRGAEGGEDRGGARKFLKLFICKYA